MIAKRNNYIILILVLFISLLIAGIFVVNKKISQEMSGNIYIENKGNLPKKDSTMSKYHNNIPTKTRVTARNSAKDNSDNNTNKEASRLKEKKKIIYEIPVAEPVLLQ